MVGTVAGSELQAVYTFTHFPRILSGQRGRCWSVSRRDEFVRLLLARGVLPRAFFVSGLGAHVGVNALLKRSGSSQRSTNSEFLGAAGRQRVH